MEIERQRGISVATSVLAFIYKNKKIKKRKSIKRINKLKIIKIKKIINLKKITPNPTPLLKVGLQ